MKSLNQLAQSAYEAYRKATIQLDEEGLAGHALQWAELDDGTRACWLAVAKQLWAEFAAVH
jgi:hypothetical protein